jgi:hypothetical protein
LEIELTGDLAVIGHFSAAIYKIIYHDIEEICPDKVYTGAYKTTTEEALAPTWTKT